MKQSVVAGLDQCKFYYLHIKIDLQAIAAAKFLLVKHKV